MRTLFSIATLLIMVFSCAPAFSITQSGAQNAQFDLNLASPNMMAKHKLGDKVTIEKKWVLKGTYNVVTQGGLVGVTYNLTDPNNNSLRLPKGAVVHNCVLDFITQPTSAGSATFSISTGQSAADLKSALAKASATGLVACVPVGTAATSIKMTADRTPTIIVNTATATTGKVNVLIEYYLSDSQ